MVQGLDRSNPIPRQSWLIFNPFHPFLGFLDSLGKMCCSFCGAPETFVNFFFAEGLMDRLESAGREKKMSELADSWRKEIDWQGDLSEER